MDIKQKGSSPEVLPNVHDWWLTLFIMQIDPHFLYFYFLILFVLTYTYSVYLQSYRMSLFIGGFL